MIIESQLRIIVSDAFDEMLDSAEFDELVSEDELED